MKKYEEYVTPLVTLTAKDVLAFINLSPKEQLQDIKNSLSEGDRRELTAYLDAIENPTTYDVFVFLINKLKEENKT